MTIHDFTYTGGDSGVPYQVQQYDRLDRAVTQTQYYFDSVQQWYRDARGYATTARQDRDHIQSLGDTIVSTGQQVEAKLDVAVAAADTAVNARDTAADHAAAAQTARTGAETAETNAGTHATNSANSASTAADILAANQALGITVDTSVGTRVFVGDTMIYGDTGWRDVTTGVSGVLEGQITIKRSSGSVWLHLVDVLFEDQGTSYTHISRMIPVGFRYGGEGFIFLPIGQRSSARSAGPVRTDQYGHTRFEDSQNKVIDALVQWESGGVDSWPTSLPGTPL